MVDGGRLRGKWRVGKGVFRGRGVEGGGLVGVCSQGLTCSQAMRGVLLVTRPPWLIGWLVPYIYLAYVCVSDFGFRGLYGVLVCVLL